MRVSRLRRPLSCEISGLGAIHYPNGLAGQAIPQAGGIAALADVFDALTSARPYKKAWKVEAAVIMIEEDRGKHFEPQLVAFSCVNSQV